jgi:hypothetical protein
MSVNRECVHVCECVAMLWALHKLDHVNLVAHNEFSTGWMNVHTTLHRVLLSHCCLLISNRLRQNQTLTWILPCPFFLSVLRLRFLCLYSRLRCP